LITQSATELAPGLLQAAVETISVLLDGEVTARRRVDDHDAIAAAIAGIDEVYPGVRLVEVDELRFDLLLYAFHTSGFEVSHSTSSTFAPCSSRWSTVASVITDLPTPPLLPPTQQMRPEPLPSLISTTSFVYFAVISRLTERWTFRCLSCPPSARTQTAEYPHRRDALSPSRSTSSSPLEAWASSPQAALS